MMIRLSVTSGQADPPTVNEIHEKHIQFDFGIELIELYFNTKPYQKDFSDLLAGFSMTEQDRQRIIQDLVAELNKYPSAFIGKYAPENIFVAYILEQDHTGYHMDNLVVLHGPDEDFLNNFHHEIGHNIVERREWDPALLQLFDFFREKNYSVDKPGPFLHDLPQLYSMGFVSAYSASSPEEEFCEIFSALMEPDLKDPLYGFIHDNPGSLLARKTEAVIDYIRKHVNADMQPGFYQLFAFNHLTEK